MLNTRLYRAGMNEFENRDIWNMNEEDFMEEVENLIWNAIYNDNHMIQSEAEGYAIIAEYHSIEEAEEYLRWRHQDDLDAVA